MFKSFAKWPAGTEANMPIDRITTVKHETKEQAEAVCSLLRKVGYEGRKEIYPEKVWVEKI